MKKQTSNVNLREVVCVIRNEDDTIEIRRHKVKT